MLPIVYLSNHFRNLLLDILFSYLLLYHFFAMNTSSHEKLAIQRHIQSDEENRLMNQIHGLETAQGNLTAYLETGKGSDTILNKLQQNETTLKTLRQQLVYKKTEIPTVDEDTYRRLVKQFKHYMSHVKSPEASALKTAAIQDIEIQKEDIIVKFCEGVPIYKETEAYFHLQ